MIAARKATEIIQRFNLTDVVTEDDLHRIRQAEGILFLDNYPFVGRVRERYINHNGIALITLKGGLNSCERKHYLAHALGHHFLHRGSHLLMDNIRLTKQELQAETFAAFLLMPAQKMEEVMRANPAPWHLAQVFGVSVDLARKRIELEASK